MARIYVLRISLMDSEPLVWRRIHIHKEICLPSLQDTIQTVMCWTGYRRFLFITQEGTVYTPIKPKKGQDESEEIYYKKKKIKHILQKEGDCLYYEYGHSNCLMHEIKLEAIPDVKRPRRYPILVDGEGDRPPENFDEIDWERYVRRKKDQIQPWEYQETKDAFLRPYHVPYDTELIDKIYREFRYYRHNQDPSY